MPITRDAFSALKRTIDGIGRDGMRGSKRLDHGRVPFEIPDIDQTLGGGLARGSVHEIMASSPRDYGAATGFALGLMSLLTKSDKHWVWIREDMAGRELGEPYGPGLISYGLNPSKLLLVAAPDAKNGLQAAEESLRYQRLGGVLLEPWGDPKALDQTARRRLSLTAEEAGVTLLILRSGGHTALGSSRTRWEISASPSLSEGDFELGLPAFLGRLVLNRQTGAGGPTGVWMMEWSYDKCLFRQANFVSRVSPSGDRPAAEKTGAVYEHCL
jgi:protein ImuA